MKENNMNVGYYSIIPATILFNKNLKPNQKLLYAMITSLTCKEGYCFATNSYFAEKLNVHYKTISSWISDLNKKNFIKVEIIRNKNNKIIQRKIYINNVPYPLKNVYQYLSKNEQAIHQNTESNIINNNIKKIIKHQRNIFPITQIKENILQNFLKDYMQMQMHLLKNNNLQAG